MASISLGTYVGYSWHVTQADRNGHYTGEPASLLEITKITGHAITSDHDVSRTIGVLMKSAQTGTFSVNNAIGRTVGKPFAAIEAKKA